MSDHVEDRYERRVGRGPYLNSVRTPLEAALPELLETSRYPLGVSPSDFENWYSNWWPKGQQAKPGTGLVMDWFADAEAQIQDGAPLSEQTEVVRGLIAEMQRTTEPG
jgi:hypothetical protein